MVLLNLVEKPTTPLSAGQPEEGAWTYSISLSKRNNSRLDKLPKTAHQHSRGTEVCPVAGGCRGFRSGHWQRSGGLTHSQFGGRSRCQIGHWFAWSGKLIFWNLLCIVCRKPSCPPFQLSSKPPWLSSLAFIHLWEVTIFHLNRKQPTLEHTNHPTTKPQASASDWHMARTSSCLSLSAQEVASSATHVPSLAFLSWAPKGRWDQGLTLGP